MTVTILKSRVTHRVIFEPDPRSKHMPTAPQPVASRMIRDIQEFPEGVTYIYFADVIETEVQIGDRIETVTSKVFNKSSPYFVLYEAERPRTGTFANAQLYGKIPVHESIVGKLWIYGDARQLQEQKIPA